MPKVVTSILKIIKNNSYKLHQMKQRTLLTKLFRLQIYILTVIPVAVVQAQDGIYGLKNDNGSYSLISMIKNQNKITAEIFTWWNTPSAQTGSYYGQGIMINNRVVLKSNENDPDCIVTMALTGRTINTTFEKCTTDHLTEDFNGRYQKISDAVAGDYRVKVDKSFFYSKPDEYSKQKSYLIKGNTVSFNLDGGVVGNWIFIHYRHKSGKDTSGYLKLSDLKKLYSDPI